jgi:hypothetical protein
MARTPREIDYSVVEGMARIQCTEGEMAVALGFTPEGFSKRKKKDEELVQAIERGKGTGKMSLRRLQWKAAEAGNITMMIWLGKQTLGQADKQEIQQETTLKMYGQEAPVEDV